MIIHGYIMLVVVALEILLGVYLLRFIRNNPAIRWYLVIILGVVIYVISNAVTYLDHSAPVFWHLSQWFGGVIITAGFLMFSLFFPYRNTAVGPMEWLLFWLPVILLGTAIYFTGDFIASLNHSFFPAKQNYGPVVLLFPVFFFFYWLIILFELVKKWLRADGTHKYQLSLFIFGAILVPLIASAIFDVVLPINNIVGLGWIGPELTVLWLGFTSYLLVKR